MYFYHVKSERLPPDSQVRCMSADGHLEVMARNENERKILLPGGQMVKCQNPAAFCITYNLVSFAKKWYLCDTHWTCSCSACLTLRDNQ